MAKITIEVEFDEIQEDGYTRYEYKNLKIEADDLTDSERCGLAETWAQSDWFYTEFTANIINNL